MLTYTSRRNLYGKLSNDLGATNLTLGDTLMDSLEKKISKKFNFLENSRYASTVASQQFYGLPNDFGKMKTITVTIGTTKYFPSEITSRDQWDSLNESTSETSDIPEYYYIFNGEVGFYPKPSAATADAIYMQYNRKFKGLSVADYTTGSVSAIANGDSTVTGSGTSWTNKMAGMWIMIADSSTANTGDGVWYEIDSVESATSLTLLRPYQGLTIAAGSAGYTIGQVSLLPEEFQTIPVFEALEIYFSSVKHDTTKMASYKAKTRELKEDLLKEHGSASISPVVSEEDIETKNPNLYVTG